MKMLTLFIRKHTTVLALLLALLLLATTLTGCFDTSTLGASNGDGTEGVTTDDATTGGDPDGTTAGEETTDEGESTEPLPELELPSEAVLEEMQANIVDHYSWLVQAESEKIVPHRITYYGRYHDFEIVRISFIYVSNDTTILDSSYDVEIGGHVFRMEQLAPIYAWKDGTLIHLKDAYDQGLLTDEHIETIARIKKNKQYIRIDCSEEF